MGRKEVKVNFKTITPLWTGDAWQESKEIRPSSDEAGDALREREKIRPSSLIGSLRFWFETLMYFAGVLEKEEYNKELGRFEKEVDRKKLRNCLKNKGNDFDSIIECLKEQNIPISSVVFGTTNWKGLIGIKEIGKISSSKDYLYPLGKVEFPEFRHNKEIPTWYFRRGFYGSFEVVFSVEEEILEPIFYPLLNFMDNYGFWGGKWNIGYGRLKVEGIIVEENSINLNEKNIFNLTAMYYDRKIEFSPLAQNIQNEIVEKVNNFEDLYNSNLANQDKKVKVYFYKGRNTNNTKNSQFKSINIIRELLKVKINKRRDIQDAGLRHKIFGKTGRLDYTPQGSKILPFIWEENGQLKGGFLSIAGLLTLEGGQNG